MITKEQFIAANKKYPENKFSKFILDKFLRTNTYNKYKLFFIGEFFIFNILAGIFLQSNKALAIKFCLIGNGIFFFIGFIILIAGIINIFRTKKLCDELNCNTDELNMYSSIYNN